MKNIVEKVKAVRKASYSHEELFGIYLDIKSGDTMTAYKVEELKEICASLDIPVTGNKSVLIHRIKEELENEFSARYSKLGNVYMLNNMAWNFIIVNHLDEVFTRKLVRTMSRGHIIRIADKKTHTTIEKWVNYESYDSCEKIIESGFRDTIYDDIFQEVRTYIWQCVENGTCYVCNGRIKFVDDSMNFDYSVYHGAIDKLTKCLSKYRGNKSQKRYDSDIEHMVSYDKNGNEMTLSIDNPNVIPILSEIVDIHNLEHMDDIKAFIKWIESKYPKKAERISRQIAMRLCGYNQAEMAKKLGITVKTVQRDEAFRISAYKEYRTLENKKFIYGKPSPSETYGGYMKNAINNSIKSESFGHIGNYIDWESGNGQNTINVESVTTDKNKELTDTFRHYYNTYGHDRDFAVSMATKKGKLHIIPDFVVNDERGYYTVIHIA